MEARYRVVQNIDGLYVVQRRGSDGGLRMLKQTFATVDGAERRAAVLNLRYKYLMDATQQRIPGAKRRSGS